MPNAANSRTSSDEMPKGKGSEKLVAAAQAGSAAARDELYAEFRSLITWHARKYTSNESEVDDISQEALMGFMRAIDTFDAARGVQFNTYATTCISNASISAVRRLQTQDSHLIYEGDHGVAIEDFGGSGFEDAVLLKFANKELNQKLQKELTALEYQVFSLRAKGYPPRDIAHDLKLEVSSVNNALGRARKKAELLAE